MEKVLHSFEDSFCILLDNKMFDSRRKGLDFTRVVSLFSDLIA